MENRIKKGLIILIISIVMLVTACSNDADDPKILESYQEMRTTYEDLENFNDEILLLVEDFFASINKIENNEDNIEEYIEDNLEEVEKAKETQNNYRQRILDKAKSGDWDNRDMADSVVILDNVETALDVIGKSYINVKEYNETRDKDASNIYIIMMDVGVIQDLLLDNRQRAEENREVFYYRIQNY